MVVLYNETTKKWFFFYLHILTLCVIMAPVRKRKKHRAIYSDGRQIKDESVRKGKGLLC